MGENLLVKDLDPEDLNLLRESGVDLSAFARDAIRSHAAEIRTNQRHAYRLALIRRVAEENRTNPTVRVSTQDIVDGIHADRRASGGE